MGAFGLVDQAETSVSLRPLASLSPASKSPAQGDDIQCPSYQIEEATGVLGRRQENGTVKLFETILPVPDSARPTLMAHIATRPRTGSTTPRVDVHFLACITISIRCQKLDVDGTCRSRGRGGACGQRRKGRGRDEASCELHGEVLPARGRAGGIITSWPPRSPRTS